MNCPTEEGGHLRRLPWCPMYQPTDLARASPTAAGKRPQEHRSLRPNSITSGLYTVKELRTHNVDGRRKQPAFPIKEQPMEKLPAADRLPWK